MEINFTLVIQAINFLIAFWLLKILYVSKLKPIFEARAGKIARDLEEAEAAKSDAQAEKAEYEERLREAKKEAASLLKQAEEHAEKVRAEIVSKGKEEAARLVEKAREESEREKEHLLQEVKGYTADLAVAMATRLIRESSEPALQNQLVESFIRKAGR